MVAESVGRARPPSFIKLGSIRIGNWTFSGATDGASKRQRPIFAGAVEQRRDVLVTLVSELARNYLELRGTQQRLAVAQENLANQTNVLELVRSQNKAGLSSRLDETRAAAQVATTASTIPPIEAGARRAITRAFHSPGPQPTN